MNKKLIISLSALALLAVGATFFLTAPKHNQSFESDSTVEEWKLFKRNFHKKYADPDYEHYRFTVFSQNLNFIKENPTNYGITQFMDLTPQEFSETYLTLATDMEGDISEEITAEPVDNIDWVAEGIVTPVKNQGQCGSCWAFSTTGAVEAFLNKPNKNNSISLSEQYLVDCSKENSGCNGGLMDSAMSFIESKQITTGTEYPYTGKDGACKSIDGKTQYSIKSHKNVKNCNDLYSALSKVPVAVAVDASNFQFYSKGIFSNCRTSLNHGVLLTGYTAAEGTTPAFWTIKNSWGTSWGMQGFIELAYGNTCGVCSMASYVFA